MAPPSRGARNLSGPNDTAGCPDRLPTSRAYYARSVPYDQCQLLTDRSRDHGCVGPPLAGGERLGNHEAEGSALAEQAFYPDPSAQMLDDS